MNSERLDQKVPLFMGYILGVVHFKKDHLMLMGMTENEISDGENFLKAYTRCLYKRDDDVKNNDS